MNNNEIPITSQNCIGGFIFHDLGVRFNSPTVNLYLDASDFIKFVDKLDYYLKYDLRFDKNKELYPIGYLENVKIYLLLQIAILVFLNY